MKNIKDSIDKVGYGLRDNTWLDIYRNISNSVGAYIRINAWIPVHANIAERIQNNIYESIKTNLKNK